MIADPGNTERIRKADGEALPSYLSAEGSCVSLDSMQVLGQLTPDCFKSWFALGARCREVHLEPGHGI